MKELFASLEAFFSAISQRELQLNRSVSIRVRLLRKQLSILRDLFFSKGNRE